MPAHMIAIPIDPETEQALALDSEERHEVLRLGLREWNVRKALEACRRGEISLARAAEMAAVPLREMIPLAYAHGLSPKVPEALRGSGILSLKEAARL